MHALIKPPFSSPALPVSRQVLHNPHILRITTGIGMQDRSVYCLFLLAVVLAACAGCTATVGDLHPGGDTPGGGCSFSTPALVARVIDGDTFCVTYRDGSGDTVRILGIDTPETNDRGNSEKNFAGVPDPSYLTAWGERASSFTRDLLLGKNVTLSGDCRAGSRDRYGRLLAYVTSGSTDIGSLLVREGYARVYTGEDFSRKQEYLALQMEAQGSGAGLWNAARVPGGSGDGPVRIVSVQYDAPGDDREDLNGEYVVIKAVERTDLAGWTLEEGDGARFHFPPLALGAGETLTIHAGVGIPGGDDLYWNQASPVLGNSADSVVLKDPDGKTVSSWSWG